MEKCKHPALCFLPSRHASQAGYACKTVEQILDATSVKTIGKEKPDINIQTIKYNSSTFPAPLVLPGDELSFDPNYEPQTASDCINNRYRNKVTEKRKTVYVVPAPEISETVDFVADWARAQPNVGSRTKGKASKPASIPKPSIEDTVSYLQAFYCGLPVKTLDQYKLSFVPWELPPRKKSSSKRERPRVGLEISPSQQVFDIRHRPSKDNLYSGQLNLNDLLDVAIAIMPKDAYAVLMLIDHDLYEDEQDDFCCGRAYGGSGVAVVSLARYNPILDPSQEVEVGHSWPASHCEGYMEAVCAAAAMPTDEEQPSRPKVKKTIASSPSSSAMHAALKAYSSLPQPKTAKALSNLWLGRFCKTASHELGHCFGIDHCVYFACVMQGTSGLTEDGAQPQYLCPVDLAKVLHATGATESEHCRALLSFSERFPADKMFHAFAEWLQVRLREVNGSVQGKASGAD